MRYLSTRGAAPAATLGEALLRGLAPDGGLYLPETLPDLPIPLGRGEGPEELAALATEVLAPFAVGEIGRWELAALLREALDFPIPLVRLEDDLWLLELFHGPTLAFKDVAARTMARLMTSLRAPGGALTVLVATSGDTGSAVASAFFGVEGVRVVVLYPEGRVSPLQEAQLTTLGGNVTAVSVAGTFDDCQRLAKGAFSDPALVEAVGLTSANSINIGRLLPQMVYYVHAVGQLARHAPTGPGPVIGVPSGNFGNLTAGLMAARMGLAVTAWVAGTNVNDVVPEYLRSGHYRPRPAQRTLSNAMDVGDPSNFERILALVGGRVERVRGLFSASAHDDRATLAAIAEVHRRTGTVLDPHTAVGYLALRGFLDRSPGRARGVLIATAHPAKFADDVAAAIGHRPALPERLAACLERPRALVRMPPEQRALASLLAPSGA